MKKKKSPFDHMRFPTKVKIPRERKKLEKNRLEPVPAESWPSGECERSAPAKTNWELPHRYGETKIRLMVVDPCWAFAYWEIEKPREEEALASLGGAWDRVKSVLRVHCTRNGKSQDFFDIALCGLADHWYINVFPGASYRVEIGLLNENGRFVPLARSNTVTTPSNGLSDALDEEWMAVSGGICAQSGLGRIGSSFGLGRR